MDTHLYDQSFKVFRGAAIPGGITGIVAFIARKPQRRGNDSYSRGRYSGALIVAAGCGAIVAVALVVMLVAALM